MNIADAGEIGAAHAERLQAAGVETAEDVLRLAAGREGRRRLAEICGLPEQRILAWFNHLDLVLLDGVGPTYARLLEAAGVESTRALGSRDPRHLAETLADLIAARATQRHVPQEPEVRSWVEAARLRDAEVER